MADRSAAALAEAVLEDDTARSAAMLAEPLALDPPLAVWAVLAAATHDAFRPRSLGELAAWLAGSAVAVLRWDPKRDGPYDASADPHAETFADLTARRLEIADAAALLAASDGQPAAELAYLAGLLFRPDQWLAVAASGGKGRRAAAPLEPPEAVRFGPAVQDHVTRAARVLAGQEPDVPPELDVEAVRRRADLGRQAWLALAAGLADRLPALLARLARLDDLQRRFHETLQAEKLSAMAEFAAGAGHEINNPLAIIGGRAQLLLQEEADPERRRELAVINAQVRRAHEMIADMRLFARPPQPEPETFDLAELADSLAAELAPSYAQRAIAVERTGQPGPLEIDADPAQLQVALRALCKNALEAIGHRGRIEIRLGRTAAGVEIVVSDDGPGIPPEVRRHLFDPFYSARQAGRGLGLGLSKCWRIATNHGGSIDVQSEPGQGTTFTITLPQHLPSPACGRGAGGEGGGPTNSL